MSIPGRAVFLREGIVMMTEKEAVLLILAISAGIGIILVSLSVLLDHAVRIAAGRMKIKRKGRVADGNKDIEVGGDCTGGIQSQGDTDGGGF